LTRPFDKHLDSDELDGLVSSHAASVTGSEQLSEHDLREAQRHVESCQDCSRRLQMHESVHSEILNMGVPRNAPAGPDCVADNEWLDVAAGLLPEAETRQLMKHAAQCGHCGPLLKSAAETLADDVTPSEERLLAALSSARPEWQMSMASTLRSRVQERHAKPPWWRAVFARPTPVLAFAGMAAIVIVAWIGMRTLRPPSAERLLAQAYSDHRTLEVRIPGAKYAPMQAERGIGGSDFDKSPSLLKAEILIGEHLSKNPNNPAWLQAQARAYLLDGKYEPAIKSLQRALLTQPDSPTLLTDLGSAYFMQAESEDRPIDYGNAIESLGRALAKSPDDPVALFNRALACERMFLYTQAVDDWEHYLRIDQQGEWADEARQRLAFVKQKLEQREKSLSEPLLGPDEIAKAGANDATVRDEIDERIEEYFRVAITDWLPQAFPESSERPSVEARAALSELAKITREKHEDMWLVDLLGGPTAGQFPAGVKALATSLRANDRGDYQEDQESARKAADLFRASGNRAGELRAGAEEVYSDHLLWEGPRCLALLRSMDEPLKRKSFMWIRAQMRLEQSNCANLVGDLGTYQTAIGQGMKEADAHKYPALRLRALGFQALSDASLGESASAFSCVSEGLALFWSSKIDLMKGYNLYTDLDAAADGLNLSNLQVVISREATTLVDRQPDILLRAMAHRWYGYAAYLANMTTLANAEFSKASALFDASPRTVSTTRHHTNAEIWLAQIEIRQGDLERATARLQRAKPLLDMAPSFGLEIEYYTAEADISMRTGDSAAAESAIRSAIFLAEWALDSYPKEEGRRQWADESRGAYRDLVEWKLREGDATSALELWEWYQGAALRANLPAFPRRGVSLGADNPPDPRDAPLLPSPTVVTDRLPLLHDETVVAYGTFPDGIAVWAYDDRGVFSKWIPTTLPLIQELALRFERLCSNPTSDLVALRTTASLLYDRLVAPVEDRFVPGRTIVFEPDDFLAGIPWDALVDRDSHYLAERSAVVVAPGLYRTMRLRTATRITQETPALIVSVPAVPTEHLATLVDADDEARAVAGKFVSAHWVQGTNATLAAIHMDIRGRSVFHFAGHAITSPQRSGLVLADIDPDTRLSRLIGAGSFAEKETSALQLAVLSACHTEGETELGTSGTESLAESFLSAGVPHVVASLWNVDSSQTSEFMKEFYAHLIAGSDVSDAVHTAKLALAFRPASAHPYYWAAFELQGLK
jgi:tetratricopeptide (TPR) repeat protein